MAAFLAEFDNLVVGRVLGVTALGFYSIATKLPYLFIISLASVAGDVLLPASPRSSTTRWVAPS